MFVYRIEHAISLDGPYNPENDYSIITDDLRDSLYHTQGSNSHPSMWIDCNFMHVHKDYQCSDYFCGFNSCGQMIAWFNQAFDTLHDHGFIVAVYDCDDSLIVAGTYQIAFVRNKAKRVDVITIPDMLNMA